MTIGKDDIMDIIAMEWLRVKEKSPERLAELELAIAERFLQEDKFREATLTWILIGDLYTRHGQYAKALQYYTLASEADHEHLSREERESIYRKMHVCTSKLKPGP